MVTIERAAALMQMMPREIGRGAETGELHFVETNSEELLICVASLGASSLGRRASPGRKGEGSHEKKTE